MRVAQWGWLLGLIAAAVSAGSACNRSEPARTTAEAPRTIERSDASIATSVQAKFYADDAIRGSDIDVTTSDGVVTLRGTVENETTRQQALTLARQTEGVARVEDELRSGPQGAAEIIAERSQPPARPSKEPTARTAEGRVNPLWVTTKIQAQYFASPDVKPWNIDVTTTSDGVVTLRGQVENARAKDEATRIARATEGVTRVEDQLRLKDEAAATTGSEPPRTGRDDYGIDQPDPWITARVQAKYFLDDQVKGRNIDVDTRDGVVTLTGVVGSEAEQRRAVALARNTEGVRRVENRLQVTAELGAPRTAARGADERLNDAWITTKIQAQYFLDADVKGRNIDVDTRNGVVTLKGSVDAVAQKQIAEQIARDTEGVSRVVNQLTVKTAQNGGRQEEYL
jgi:osmotically-inducible protein OsmY